MGYEFTVLGIISALMVLVPGVTLLVVMRGVKSAVLRNLTIILASFAVLHGIYHTLLLVGLPPIANPLDLISVLLLILFAVYYSLRGG